MIEAALPFTASAAAVVRHLPRPDGDNPDVRQVALGLLADRCLPWGRADGITRDQWIEDLRKATRGDPDGYAIARKLDDAGWSGIDAALVEILDGWSIFLHQSEEAAVTAWVTRNGVTPRLEPGAHCKVDGQDGVIVAIDRQRAVYTVRIAACGHLSAEDRAAGKGGTVGAIHPYEKVEAA